MQAIIMAAGRGSRLGGFTDEKPKAFLEIQGYKMIEYNLAMLHSFGIRDITIVTGYRRRMFEELAADIPGVKCRFNPFYEMTNVLGSFYMGQDALKEDTAYLHADTLCSPKVFQKMLEAEGELILPVAYGPCDEEAMKVRTVQGRVTEINKTMDCQTAEGEFIGIALIRQEALRDLKTATEELMEEKSFSSYFEAAIQRLIDKGGHRIRPISTEGEFWGEVDFLEDYQAVRDRLPEELQRMARELRHMGKEELGS